MATRTTTILSPETSILIVDDSTDYASVLTRILRNGMGYQNVVATSSLDEAYALISSDPGAYSMLFVDYHFPNGRTGRDLIQKLEAEHLLNDKVAFFITAEPSVKKAIEASEHGLSGVVIKPFNKEHLMSQIARVDRDLQVESAYSGDCDPITDPT